MPSVRKKQLILFMEFIAGRTLAKARLGRGLNRSVMYRPYPDNGRKWSARTRLSQLLPSCKSLCLAQRPKQNSSRPCSSFALTLLPEGPDWAYELELGGYRALGIKSYGVAHLRSRNNKSFDGTYSSTIVPLLVPMELIDIRGQSRWVRSAAGWPLC
jgi:ATP-dependent DNA ligase